VSWVDNAKFLAGTFFILGMLNSVYAGADFKKCCVMAARAKYTLYLDTLPRETCAIDSNTTGSVNPSVNNTMSWCEQNCPGHQLSTTSEWLHPITTWIIPYAGLLFLCPISERGEIAVNLSIDKARRFTSWAPLLWSQKHDSWTSPMMKWLSNFHFSIFEYGGFLGDPASAIWGAFSELAEDWWLSRLVLHATELRRELLATAILAGQSEFDAVTKKNMTNTLITRFLLDIVGYEDAQEKRGSQDEKSRNSLSGVVTLAGDNSPDLPPLDPKEISATVTEKQSWMPPTTIKLRDKLENSLDVEGEHQWDSIDTTKVAKAVMDMAEGHDAPSDLFSGGSADEFTTALDQVLRAWNRRPADARADLLLQRGTLTYRIWDGIRILLEARVDFVNTVLIPVILMLVVTAAVFYDAYQNLGDNDTAHSLAYGLLYSWLIILAVASNCYTSSLTYGLLDRTIGSRAKVLPISPITVGLCDRYTNALRWRIWLGELGVVERPVAGKKTILFRYLAGQLFAWACVAIVASCAAAISYTTPTVGIGCRSFNHFLYALVSLMTCLVPVVRFWNEMRDTAERKKERYRCCITWIYRFFVMCNVAILLIGTLLHLIGIFRSCWCMNIFVHKSRILELNTMTAEAIRNATLYWLPVGYVAFIFIWLVSASAIVMREVINFRVSILQSLTLEQRTGYATTGRVRKRPWWSFGRSR
jgi:hypothetical protein